MQPRVINGISVPRFLYGTAWKEDQTQALVQQALTAGFRGLDTANQRKHYFEAAVGQAIDAAITCGSVTRDALFLQTKFTFQRGQDHRLPYDPHAPIETQVEQSFASSLEHLRTDRIDSYVLHGPTLRSGLAAADWSAWRAMEALHDSGRVTLLGVSNVSLEQLRTLCDKSRIRPNFVQNRCYADQGWDRDVRGYCAANSVVYQGFSLLTANRDAAATPPMRKIAQKYGRTVSQIIFRFALDAGILPLTGTSSPQHLREDLDVYNFQLDPAEVDQIEELMG